MYRNLTHLLKTRRFLPLFTTQFLSAFNDNVFKFALVILIKFQMDNLSQETTRLLTTIAPGIFILPFFLFSSTAGQLADKLEKSRLIRIIRSTEIFLMMLAAMGFYLKSAPLLLLVLFLMGTKSAFFGPLKYGILPDHLKKDELIGGNGLVEMATFLSILLGTIIGGILIADEAGRIKVSTLVIGLAVLGYMASRFIPKAHAPSPGLKINYNFLGEAVRIICTATDNRPVMIAITGISWFWLIGATFLAQFPNYTRDILFGDEKIATLFLFSLSAGVGVGSILCNRLLKGLISARLVPFAALGLSIFCIDLFFSTGAGVKGTPDDLMTMSGFLDHPANWRIFLDLVLIAVFGGLYIVPLYSILQTRAKREIRSRMIAANNIMNSLFMVVSAALTIGLFQIGFDVVDVFLSLGIANLLFAAFFWRRKGWENPLQK